MLVPKLCIHRNTHSQRFYCFHRNLVYVLVKKACRYSPVHSVYVKHYTTLAIHASSCDKKIIDHSTAPSLYISFSVRFKTRNSMHHSCTYIIPKKAWNHIHPTIPSDMFFRSRSAASFIHIRLTLLPNHPTSLKRWILAYASISVPKTIPVQ